MPIKCNWRVSAWDSTKARSLESNIVKTDLVMLDTSASSRVWKERDAEVKDEEMGAAETNLPREGIGDEGGSTALDPGREGDDGWW